MFVGSDCERTRTASKLAHIHVTCDTWPRANEPLEFSGVAEGLAGVLQGKDIMSPGGGEGGE